MLQERLTFCPFVHGCDEGSNKPPMHSWVLASWSNGGIKGTTYLFCIEPKTKSLEKRKKIIFGQRRFRCRRNSVVGGIPLTWMLKARRQMHGCATAQYRGLAKGQLAGRQCHPWEHRAYYKSSSRS